MKILYRILVTISGINSALARQSGNMGRLSQARQDEEYWRGELDRLNIRTIGE